ncbi:MAG: TAXI family TRAP transporter solute-binding subunit [Alphaproteobacteria bacterium]|nr:TAXI family TRAP transporter solute-binding subunit [Alphaproteobacteria bacterium]
MRYVSGIFAIAAGITVAGMPTVSHAQSDQMSLVVGSLGGTMGRLGSGIVDVFNNNEAGSKLSVTPGGGRANPARVGEGGGDFGFSFTNFVSTAIAGQAPYDKAYPNLRAVARFYDACYHQYVAKDLYDSGIKSWEDIVKSSSPLKVGISKKGTSTEFVGSVLVDALGSSYKQLEDRGYKLTFAGTSANSRAIRSKQVDIYFHNSGDPNGAGVEAALGRDLRFLDMSPKVKSILASNGFTPCVIPGGLYKGVDNNTDSMGLAGMVFTTEDMSADAVYAMLKQTNENLDTLGNVHKVFKSWNPEYASQVGSIPMHEGAMRFFKEKGVMK